MKTFDMQRFLLTMKWDVISNWKESLKIMLTMTFAMGIMFAITLFGKTTVEANDWVVDTVMQQQGLFGLFGFIVFMVVGASRIFNNMRTKQQRTAFLMLPASNAEKFVARWLWATVGQLVLFVVALLLADLLQVLFSVILGKGVFGSAAAATFKMVGNIFTGGSRGLHALGEKDMSAALTLSIFMCMTAVFNHASYVLGGVFFRRNPWLLTTCAGFVLTVIISIFIPNTYWIEGWMGDDSAYLSLNIWSGILAVLTVAAYFAGYWIFKRMQVINNKWTNV